MQTRLSLTHFTLSSQGEWLTQILHLYHKSLVLRRNGEEKEQFKQYLIRVKNAIFRMLSYYQDK
jgi:hypothetical protein